MLTKKRHIAGFSLIELAVAIAILGILAAATISVSTVRLAERNDERINHTLDTVQEALLAYRKAKDRLPCPSDLTAPPGNAAYGVEVGTPEDGMCAGANKNDGAEVVIGGIPTKTLGLPDDYMYDPWNRRITYLIDRRVTAAAAFTTYPLDDADIGSIIVNDIAGARTSKAIVALVSHGKNGHGAYQANGIEYTSQSVNTDEYENCDCDIGALANGVDNVIILRTPTNDTSNSDNNFDDIVRYNVRWQFPSTSDLTDD